jgi:cytochrome c oxidase assembly protein subunit 15
MSNPQALVDLAPAARLGLLAVVIALLPLSWVWLRQRSGDTRVRLLALTTLTLFLTFDLVVFGAYTRLSDSGLGCPDWPGCYGHVSPLGARTAIDAAQALMPSGPVSWSKAWIEMVHRYLAMTVGVLILALAAASWAPQTRQRHGVSPLWPTLSLLWVVVQGMFGKYTVTLKLYPAFVTLHLLGGIGLVALLAVQLEALRPRTEALRGALRGGAVAALLLLGLQIALGGWVSSNYAVLACSGFPLCNGSWWPEADFIQGYTVLRELGRSGDGGGLPYPAMVAIQLAHRWFAVVAAAAVAALAWRLWRAQDRALRRHGLGLALLLLAQLASGLSNVVLGWPLAAALAHTAGAAAMVLVLAQLLARSASPRRSAYARRAALAA